MAGHTKVIQCAACQRDITVGSNTRKPRTCLECNMQRCYDNLLQIMLHSGPYYERMLAGQRRARQERGRGRGPES